VAYVMIPPAQLRDFIITPVLATLALPHADAATELLLATAMQESGCGAMLVQEGGGPALGIWQMEPATENDIWLNFLGYQKALEAAVKSLVAPYFGGSKGMADQLVGNLYYSCAMARVQYWRSPDPLPALGDVDAQAAFYLKVYNAGGKATAAEFVANWRTVMAAL
jgi:hypothetical protein